MYTQSYALGIVTLFILMIVKKDSQSVGGVDISINDITNDIVGIGNNDGTSNDIVGIGNNDGTNDIIMLDAIINATTDATTAGEKVGGTAEGKGGSKVGIDDFTKFVLPIFKQKGDDVVVNGKVIQNGTQKIDDKVKNDEPKLINGPSKGFIDGLLMHEDMKIIIPELESLFK
jgi:hypothetical protein